MRAAGAGELAPLVAAEEQDTPSTPHPWAVIDVKPLSYLLTAMLLPLAACRVVLLIYCSVAILACTFVLGRRDGEQSALLTYCLSLLGRAALLGFGVWPGCLTVSGAQADPPVPIQVAAPHLGLLEAFFFAYWGPMPRPIALEPYTKIPVASALFRAANGIAVPLPATGSARKTPPPPSSPKGAPDADCAAMSPAKPSRSGGGGDGGIEDGGTKPSSASSSSSSSATGAVRNAIQQHKLHFDPAAGDKPILLLPEGTTHNGHSLLTFFSGAFEGGGPVQPVLLRYPYQRINAAFFDSTIVEHFRRLLLAPVVRVHVTYLPVYYPSEQEAASPELFSENVRAAMASAGGLPLSTYGARELKKELRSSKTK